MDHVYRAKLSKLSKLRYGSHFLPDDDNGRAMLTALLCFGLTDDSAIGDAPWCGPQLATLRQRARRLKWCNVGKLIGLTFDEWKAAKLWIMRPIDKSEAELDAWREERRRESSRKSKQKARQKKREQKQRMLAKAKTSPPRQAAILEMLLNTRWPMRAPELIKLAAKSRAFNKPQSSAVVRNLRDAVHTTLDQLEAMGAVTTELWPGKRGPVRLVRVRRHEQTFPCDQENERRTVGPTILARVA